MFEKLYAYSSTPKSLLGYKQNICITDDAIQYEIPLILIIMKFKCVFFSSNELNNFVFKAENLCEVKYKEIQKCIHLFFMKTIYKRKKKKQSQIHSNVLLCVRVCVCILCLKKVMVEQCRSFEIFI